MKISSLTILAITLISSSSFALSPLEIAYESIRINELEQLCEENNYTQKRCAETVSRSASEVVFKFRKEAAKKLTSTKASSFTEFLTRTAELAKGITQDVVDKEFEVGENGISVLINESNAFKGRSDIVRSIVMWAISELPIKYDESMGLRDMLVHGYYLNQRNATSRETLTSLEGLFNARLARSKKPDIINFLPKLKKKLAKCFSLSVSVYGCPFYNIQLMKDYRSAQVTKFLKFIADPNVNYDHDLSRLNTLQMIELYSNEVFNGELPKGDRRILIDYWVDEKIAAKRRKASKK